MGTTKVKETDHILFCFVCNKYKNEISAINVKSELPTIARVDLNVNFLKVFFIEEYLKNNNIIEIIQKNKIKNII